MKLLLVHEDSYYLVDLDTLKPKTLREVVVEVGDGKLMLAQSSQLDETDLDTMLARAFSKPEPVKEAAPKDAYAGKTRPAPHAVRAWAAKEGIKVNDMGRVPKNIEDQYLAAHKRT